MLSPGRRASALTEPLVESTVRAMSLVRGGPRGLLQAEFPRACELAGAAKGFGMVPRCPWLWAALLLAALSLALSVPVARALGGPPVSEVDPSTLPRNLTDVLKVECR